MKAQQRITGRNSHATQVRSEKTKVAESQGHLTSAASSKGGRKMQTLKGKTILLHWPIKKRKVELDGGTISKESESPPN